MIAIAMRQLMISVCQALPCLVLPPAISMKDSLTEQARKRERETERSRAVLVTATASYVEQGVSVCSSVGGIADAN